MTNEQRENSLLWQGISEKVGLGMYGEFNTIIDVSKNNGIPHDEVYKMNVNAVYTLVDIQRRQEFGQSKIQEIKRMMTQ